MLAWRERRPFAGSECVPRSCASVLSAWGLTAGGPPWLLVQTKLMCLSVCLSRRSALAAMVALKEQLFDSTNRPRPPPNQAVKVSQVANWHAVLWLDWGLGGQMTSLVKVYREFLSASQSSSTLPRQLSLSARTGYSGINRPALWSATPSHLARLPSTASSPHPGLPSQPPTFEPPLVFFAFLVDSDAFVVPMMLLIPTAILGSIPSIAAHALACHVLSPAATLVTVQCPMIMLAAGLFTPLAGSASRARTSSWLAVLPLPLHITC